ncbi:hypothetical protein [Streptomyces sp. AV19]|uniref:hypothetical protein n=1 Tax=Streptomyces sp. AV19 TaxID=2793068 RepID=UPI001F3FF234|nr:hypothetical protein [Streptomyces sp. AV19]MDG4532467.1 hypothetical protein [Streptomyces sp. AV19]
MTPHSLAFYADVITTGTLLGLKPSATPGEVTAILGDDYAENSLDSTSMWRDYGMVEFHWLRSSPEHPWEGHHFSLHVHRLSYWGGSLVNKPLRDHYGRFARRTDFTKLRRILERRGTPLVQVPQPGDHVDEFRQPASGVSVMSVRGPEQAGDLYAIFSAMA